MTAFLSYDTAIPDRMEATGELHFSEALDRAKADLPAKLPGRR
jgi:hypothetical protein